MDEPARLAGKGVGAAGMFPDVDVRIEGTNCNGRE